jgi:hypothetical protein
VDVGHLQDLNVLKADDDITKWIHVLAAERFMGVLVREHLLAFFSEFRRVPAV